MKARVDETDLTNDDPLMFGAIIVSRECSKANEDVTPMWWSEDTDVLPNFPRMAAVRFY